MKILFTGRGTSGSFQIRAVQMARAMDATVTPDASHNTIKDHDLVVLVKRPSIGLVERIQAVGKPLVWDVVDSWRQPDGNSWDKVTAKRWLEDTVQQYKPIGVVGATMQMTLDAASMGSSCLWLPHHARPTLTRNVIREVVKTVAYEGGENYLGSWRPFLEKECRKRGWQFVVNPSNLIDADIVVAVREATGYAARHWKSNVKLANAQGSGTPFIGCRESGYVETASGGEMWADTPSEMGRALDALTDHNVRQHNSDKLFHATRTLEQTAKVYKKWLIQLKS